MKKLIKYFAVFAAIAGLSVSCRLGEEEPAPKRVVSSDAIDLKVDNVTDCGCDITLTPKAAANYYGYMIMQSDKVEKIDSLIFYRGGYKDKAVSFELFKYENEKTKKITFSKLTPNVDYVVYAVSSSTTGVPSAVVAKRILTTDTGRPEIVDLNAVSIDTLVLKLSEPVSVAPGAKVEVKYYAGQSAEFLLAPKEAKPSIGTIEIPADKIKLDTTGMVAVMKLDGIHPGALYSVKCDEGTFLDVLSNKNASVKKGYLQAGKVPFKLGAFEIPEPLKSAFDPIYFDMGADGIGFIPYKGSLYPAVDPFAETEEGTPGTVDFFVNEGTRHTVDKVALPPYDGYNFDEDEAKGVIMLPKIPHNGDSVMITLPKGAYMDIYGNPSAADTIYCHYSYDESDFVGTYVASARDTVAQKDTNVFIILDKSDKEYVTVKVGGADVVKPANLMVKYWLTSMVDPSVNVYGYWNSVDNTITLYLGGVAFHTDGGGKQYFFSNGVEDYVLTLEAPTSGYIKDASLPLELYAGSPAEKVLGLKGDSFEALKVSSSVEIDAAKNRPVDF